MPSKSELEKLLEQFKGHVVRQAEKLAEQAKRSRVSKPSVNQP
jgi:histone H3/H4